ncbi:MAG: hypothetical protein JXA89_09130 [Anaerolineae bacterium]|nr:hypothetical protein [Anaerolineae bacterium]
MATHMEPDKEQAIVIRDRRKPNQYTTDNVIAREWLPVLRVGDAFFFYSVYLSMANRETESSWGSLRTLAQYLQCGIDLIIRGNKLLEICELIYIEQGNQYTSNEYYILDPPALTPALRDRIHKRLDQIESQETSKNWQAWINQVRKALARHRSLPAIWEDRRANRGGRPTTRGKEATEMSLAQKGDRESQAGLPLEKGACEPQAGRLWATSSVVVSHTQGDREPQTEQEQKTSQKNKTDQEKVVSSPEVLSVLARCQALGVATTMVEVLLERYPLDRLERQLSWLPSRKPRDPAALFVRAVQEDWSQPMQYDAQETVDVWQDWLGNVAGNKQETGKNESGSERAAADHEMGASESAQQAVELPGTGLTVQQIWQRVLQELEMQMTRVTFDTWLRGSQAVGVRTNGLVVQVRDGYAVEWLQARLLVAIQRTLSGIAGRPVDVHFEVA